MKIAILRRRKLGRTSCREIRHNMATPTCVVRNWIDQIPSGTTHAIRWGTTSEVPNGIKVFNNASAIHMVNNKKDFRLILSSHGLCPHTTPAAQSASDLKYPLVLRPAVHSRGRQLYVAHNMRQHMNLVGNHPELMNGYASPLVNKESEYRVFVVQGRVACVAKKTPGNPDDIAWNVARGGRFDNVRWNDWPIEAIDVAVKAFNLTELHFGGVDVMVCKDTGTPYVLEINSAPSLTSPYRQQSMAKCFDFMVQTDGARFPVGQEGKALKYIHPALSDKAKM